MLSSALWTMRFYLGCEKAGDGTEEFSGLHRRDCRRGRRC